MHPKIYPIPPVSIPDELLLNEATGGKDYSPAVEAFENPTINDLEPKDQPTRITCPSYGIEQDRQSFWEDPIVNNFHNLKNNFLNFNEPIPATIAKLRTETQPDNVQPKLLDKQHLKNPSAEPRKSNHQINRDNVLFEKNQVTSVLRTSPLQEKFLISLTEGEISNDRPQLPDFSAVLNESRPDEPQENENKIFRYPDMEPNLEKSMMNLIDTFKELISTLKITTLNPVSAPIFVANVPQVPTELELKHAEIVCLKAQLFAQNASRILFPRKLFQTDFRNGNSNFAPRFYAPRPYRNFQNQNFHQNDRFQRKTIIGKTSIIIFLNGSTVSSTHSGLQIRIACLKTFSRIENITGT